MAVKFDEIGYWSEIKLEIIQKYASAYSTIMNKQALIKQYYYIDGFSGAGVHISKNTGNEIPGSPTNALQIQPPFSGYYFIDLNGDKTDYLRENSKNYQNVNIYNGDCNLILLKNIFPNIRYEDYKRALCLLDPYGLQLEWDVMNKAGHTEVIEIFLNFPVMDMNRNVLWKNPEKVDPAQIERMNAFWGDETWRAVAYKKEKGLFDTIEEKVSNEDVAEAFRKRLKEVAGFKYVADPMPMRNSKGGIVYYLFFASPNKTGPKIVQDIMNKYKNKGV